MGQQNPAAINPYPPVSNPPNVSFQRGLNSPMPSPVTSSPTGAQPMEERSDSGLSPAVDTWEKPSKEGKCFIPVCFSSHDETLSPTLCFIKKKKTLGSNLWAFAPQRNQIDTSLPASRQCDQWSPTGFWSRLAPPSWKVRRPGPWAMMAFSSTNRKVKKQLRRALIWIKNHPKKI